MPDVVPIVATPTLLLLQVPPVVASVRVRVADWHSGPAPIILAGGAITEIVSWDVQPAAVV